MQLPASVPGGMTMRIELLDVTSEDSTEVLFK